ncbi:hypothetical protein ACSAZK_14230 [Methanosarcina sp. Mfa9]
MKKYMRKKMVALHPSFDIFNSEGWKSPSSAPEETGRGSSRE